MGPLLILVLGLLLRIILIHLFPPIFGGDTISRLAYPGRLLLAHQPPGLQATIFLVSRLSSDPLVSRYWMAALGALAGLGFYYLARDLDLRPTTALLFVTHPYILSLSTVPYNEILMLGALCFAFHFHFVNRPGLASAFLAVACLTRYEAWAACPVLAWDYARGRRRPLVALALFFWAPLLWIVYHTGLSPAGTFVLELPRSLGRLQRYAYLAWITLKFTPPLTFLLAARRPPTGPRWRLLLIFFLLFLAAVPFSAHGVDPDPERYITARTAHLPMAAVILLAGVRHHRVLLVLACAWGLADTARFLHRETSDPRVRLGYDLSRYLDRTLGPTDTALVLTPGPPPEGVQVYLDRARRRGVLSEAQQVLAGFAEPPDYLRTLIHSGQARPRLTANPAAATTYVIVWSDYTGPTPPLGVLVTTLRAGTLEARVHLSATYGK